MSEGKVTVHIKYKDIEQTFIGSADDVWVNVNRFFSELVLAFDVARKVVLTVNLEKLVEDCKGIIGVACDYEIEKGLHSVKIRGNGVRMNGTSVKTQGLRLHMYDCLHNNVDWDKIEELMQGPSKN